jgi:hypothetical protein
MHAQRVGCRPSAVAAGQQRVDHHVAGEAHAFRIGDAFAQQVGQRAALGGVEAVGDLVGEHAVDLFGHAAVVAAQAGLDVHHRHPFFTATSAQASVELTSPTTSTQDGGARPARLEALHHLGRLHRMAARADFEVDVGRGRRRSSNSWSLMLAS